MHVVNVAAWAEVVDNERCVLGTERGDDDLIVGKVEEIQGCIDGGDGLGRRSRQNVIWEMPD